MFPESFPRSTLKFDLYHCLPLKDILKICFYHGFFFFQKKGINGVNPDEDMKKMGEKPGTWKPDLHREVVAMLDWHCQETGSKAPQN